VAERFAPATPAPRALPEAQSSAREVAGTYLSARRAHHGFLTLGDIFSTVEVAPEARGAITVSTARRSDGSLRRWLPVARDHFVEEETGSPLVFERGPSGRVARMGGELLSPVALFERAPSWVGNALPLLGAALLVIALSALSVPIGWALRRGYRRPSLPRYGLARSTLPLARLGSWVVLAVVGAWVVYLSRAQVELALLTSEANGLLLLLRVLTVLAALALVVLLVDTIVAWGDPTRGWPRRLGSVLVGAAAIALLWAVFRFELIGFGLSY
jgi:hypothetical protein